MSTGKRLDSQLAMLGLARSRNQAQQLIRSGVVKVDGVVEFKVGRFVGDANSIFVPENHLPVSRAAIKLQRAFEVFNFDSIGGKVALDIGAATGGFTQILLEERAALVIAVDVGSNQLAPELKSDPRVISLESTDARSLTGERISEEIERRLRAAPELRNRVQSLDVSLVTIDVSFISLGYLLPMLREHFATTPIVALFKPQFEVGRHGLGKNGVVTEPGLVRTAIEDFVAALNSCGGALLDATESPLLGQHGNREFLLWITMQKSKHHRELSEASSNWLEKLVDGESKGFK